MNQNKSARLDPNFIEGFYQLGERPKSGEQITHSSNVDSFVYHLGLLGFAYLVTDLILVQAQSNFGNTEFLSLPLGVLLSHNLFFVYGLIICLLFRWAIDRFGFSHLLDEGTQRQITGSSVDLMIVATIMSMQIAFIIAAVPILFVCVSVCCYLNLVFWIWKNAQSLVNRAVDCFIWLLHQLHWDACVVEDCRSDFSTSVSRELAYFNVLIIFFSAHILMFVAPLTPSIELSYLFFHMELLAFWVVHPLHYPYVRRFQSNNSSMKRLLGAIVFYKKMHSSFLALIISLGFKTLYRVVSIEFVSFH